jgi:hypothetical protein
MKLKIILTIACFAAGLAASIAFAAPQRAAEGTTTAATTSTGEHHKGGDDGDHHGDAGKSTDCKGVELKGTVTGGTLSVAVTGANHGSSALVGTTATLAVSGPVSVHARLCGTTLTLQNLEVRHAKPSAPPTGTTTTTSATP